MFSALQEFRLLYELNPSRAKIIFQQVTKKAFAIYYNYSSCSHEDIGSRKKRQKLKEDISFANLKEST